MPRRSLLDILPPRFAPSWRGLPSSGAAALSHGRRWTLRERLLRTAVQFAHELGARGIAKGSRVLIWGENSGEWVAALLGCMLTGAVAVPMDAIGEKSFAQRVSRQAGVQLAVVSRSL